MKLAAPIMGALCLSAAPAFADDAPRDSAPVEVEQARHGSANQDFHLSAGPGFAHDAVLGNVLAHSLTLGYRYGWFEPAIVGNFGSAVFGGSYASVGMALGGTLQTDSGARFGLRGVIGSDSYASVGCDLFCQRGGASATLPYAAVHASASYVFWARGRTHLELGIEGFYGHDLGKERVSYTTVGGLFGPTTSTAERTLGGERIGAFATVGLTYDAVPATSGKKLARR